MIGDDELPDLIHRPPLCLIVDVVNYVHISLVIGIKSIFQGGFPGCTPGCFPLDYSDNIYYLLWVLFSSYFI